MILLIAIGWVVILPILVVGGLYVSSRLLGARARRRGVIDVTAFAHEIADLPTPEPWREEDGPVAADQTIGVRY